MDILCLEELKTTEELKVPEVPDIVKVDDSLLCDEEDDISDDLYSFFISLKFYILVLLLLKHFRLMIQLIHLFFNIIYFQIFLLHQKNIRLFIIISLIYY